MSRSEYKFCPLCATALQPRTIYGQIRPACPVCGFVQYPDPKVAVIGFVTHGEQVLLAQRAIEPAKGKWTLPGGYMDAGELPADALVRELNEEVGLAVEVRSLIEIFPMAATTSGKSLGIVLAFHAVPADHNATALQCADDVCAAHWFSENEWPTDLAFESTQQLLERWSAGWRL